MHPPLSAAVPGKDAGKLIQTAGKDAVKAKDTQNSQNVADVAKQSFYQPPSDGRSTSTNQADTGFSEQQYYAQRFTNVTRSLPQKPDLSQPWQASIGYAFDAMKLGSQGQQPGARGFSTSSYSDTGRPPEGEPSVPQTDQAGQASNDKIRWKLKDNTKATCRSALPSDASLVPKFLKGFSDEDLGFWRSTDSKDEEECERLQRGCRNKDTTSVIYDESRKQLIGMGHIIPNTGSSTRAEVDLGISKAYQGNRLGKNFLVALFQKGYDQGFDFFIAQVYETNERAQKLCAKYATATTKNPDSDKVVFEFDLESVLSSLESKKSSTKEKKSKK